MKISPPFFLRDNYNEEVLNLLKSVTLGSNGTRYQHQWIDERIKHLYQPLFLNLERHDKVLGNVTLCRRPKNWYIRYFAFDLGLQANTKQPRSNASRESGLKKRIENFFQDTFKVDENTPETLYAYIDPRNERSLWMSQNFGFKTLASIATQTFSRVHPKKKKDVQKLSVNQEIKDLINETYGNHPFYFPHHTFNDAPFYCLMKDGKMVALAKAHKAKWKIFRLPGKHGMFLKNIIPYIPRLRKIIKPNNHVFTVVDSIWCEGNNPAYLEELFEGILFQEETNSIIWWVDDKETVYNAVKNNIKWGLMHKVNGVQKVDLVVKTPNSDPEEYKSPTYVTGFDFI